jgi:hypothetical protein
MSLAIAGTPEHLGDGTSYLHTAAELWSLVDPSRGESIRAWLRDEWAAHDDDPDLEVYDVGSLRRLLPLLEGLEEALRARLTDAHFRIDPETAVRVTSLDPTLVDSWTADGQTVYTLANRVGEVHQVRALVRRALDLDRPLEVG